MSLTLSRIIFFSAPATLLSLPYGRQKQSFIPNLMKTAQNKLFETNFGWLDVTIRDAKLTRKISAGRANIEGACA